LQNKAGTEKPQKEQEESSEENKVKITTMGLKK
jgi:hypothetical protein